MTGIIILYSKDVEKVLNYLKNTKYKNKLNLSIYNSFLQKIELIKKNPQIGNKIQRKLIPREYLLKYEINNLFRLELSNYWRLLYTLTEENNEVKLIAFVIDCLDHNEYNKKFKYKS